MLTAPLLVLIPLGLVALVVAAVLTAVDAAHQAVSRGSLEKALADQPPAVRERVLTQHGDGPRTLASVSLGRMLAEAVTVASIAAITFLVFDRLGAESAWAVPLLITIVLAGLLLLVVLAISPRTIGRDRPESVLISTRALITVARFVLWLPASALTSVGENLAARPGAAENAEDGAEKARQNVDRALEDEHVPAGERDMIQGVFELRETMVRELMVPRTDMVALDVDTSAAKAMRLFVRSGFSRIPVIGESVDDLRGMLYAKDVMKAIHSPWDPRPDRGAGEIMRPARFVPEFVAADEVLRQMQTSHVHITVVVDEYGGVSGIVTIEDILEEIVGEIADEHDPAEPEIEDLGDGRFRVPARAGLTEVGELFDLDLEDDDIDSVGGLLGKVTGQVPIVGSRAETHGLVLEAEKTSGRRRRLSTVIVSRAPEQGPHPHDAHQESTDD
ncbi:hemolysin family protein [Brachybacterium sacelli]|uniref:CBS domain containing-hemolysin-like protein n=1 Tax=Brachybacterium sacelli TaxID=173364 RepID=A0ABS4X799_9MICO|nr:hemolysin family protein [Brachybacterium sacelli]MBP2384191.1 CBS domain containing-hemolysin-like protein [Brachybacterium sacelli]